tara:strand:- start:99 stop:413 length:315 start_codon:yes stop_codon:yes gene_type:complete
MKIDDKRVTFSKSLSVKYSGKIVEETETHLTLEGEDEESYLKIFTPFRGVAKLVLYENDLWVDAETHSSITNFDFSSLGLDNMPDLSLDGDEDTKGKKTASKKK